ncbi:MAG: hypothetical protein JWM98_1186, partial [Thermoleophilia bacterium]|nr:hypothetical protein [Thermoleophilia bacterium]
MPVWGAAASLALLGAHPQTADLLSVRPPWMRGAQRTPDAARDRTVGPRVPWVTVPAVPAATTGRILVGSVAPRPVPAPVGVAPVRTAASAVPTALPQLQSQVAAWLVAPPQLPGVSTAAAHHATRGPAPDPGAVSAHEPPRFTWRAEPARLAGSTPPGR